MLIYDMELKDMLNVQCLYYIMVLIILQNNILLMWTNQYVTIIVWYIMLTLFWSGQGEVNLLQIIIS